MSTENANLTTPPGSVLKAARDECGKSIEEIAESLHLRTSVVDAMEKGRYDEFDSPVFLKGYFRSYCRLVGLHEERMIELLDAQLAQSEKDLEQEQALIKAHAKAKARNKLLLVMVVIVALAVAAGVWSTIQDGAETIVTDNVEGSIPAEGSTPVEDSIPAEGSTPVEQPSNNEGSPSESEEVQADEALDKEGLGVESEVSNTDSSSEVAIQAGDEQVVSTPDGEAVDQTKLPEAEKNETLSAELAPMISPSLTTVASQVENVSNDGLDAEAASSKVTPEVAKPRSEKVVIEFSGDCWFTLKNGDDKTVYASLKREGDRVEYEGTAPLRIVLGAADTAVVSYGGNQVDLSPYTRRNGRAEFVLD